MRIRSFFRCRCVEVEIHCSAAEFFDQADVAPLVTPGFVNHVGRKRHARQPGAWLAGLRIANVIGANESIGQLALPALVEEAFIGREVFGKILGRDFAEEKNCPHCGKPSTRKS